jgi:hypothetical protein
VCEFRKVHGADFVVTLGRSEDYEGIRQLSPPVEFAAVVMLVHISFVYHFSLAVE